MVEVIDLVELKRLPRAMQDLRSPFRALMDCFTTLARRLERVEAILAGMTGMLRKSPACRPG